MSAQPSPRNSQKTAPAPDATTRPESPDRGDGARARLTVAPDVARRRLRARLLVWGVALVTVASLFTLVSFHVFAAQSAFSLERLSKERTNEQRRYERLRLQVASLSSAQRVIVEATKLGMVNGQSPVNLSVPTAPAPSAKADVVSAESSDNSYAQAKDALGPTP